MENEYPIAALLAAAQQQFDSLVRRGVFRPVERFVCRDADREDRIAEGIAFGWRWYAQQVALGHEPDVALCVHAVRLRTVDRSRRFVSGDRTRWMDDVYNRQCRGAELLRLDGVHDHDDDDDRREQDPSLGLARLGIADPSTNIVSALDLVAWADMLPVDDREMLEMRYEGHGLEEVGKVVGRSVAGVFRRTHELGCELAQRAGVEMGPPRRGRPRRCS